MRRWSARKAAKAACGRRSMMAINPDIDCGRCPRFCARFVEWPAHFRYHVITTQGRAGIGPNPSAAVDIVRAATEDEPHLMPVVLPPFTSHFASLAGGYDVALCDVWGVVHNGVAATARSEEHTSELQSRLHLVCRLLLEKKKKK